MRQRRSRPVAALACATLALVQPGGPVAAAPRCYPPPVVARVSRPFIAPACEYCPGHRGLDYAVRPGQAVTAVGPGAVTFAGLVAGIRYVVVAQDDGLRATYGQLATSTVSRGARVARGARVGTSTDVLFFGFRDDERYLDPAPLIGTWRRRPRLVPVDGTPARPGPPPHLVCGKSHQAR